MSNAVEAHHRSIQESIVKLAKERDQAKVAVEAKQLEIEEKETQLKVLMDALEKLEQPFGKKPRKAAPKAKPAKKKKRQQRKAKKVNGHAASAPKTERNEKVYAAILKAGSDGIGQHSLADRTGLPIDEVRHAVHALKFDHKKVRSISKGMYAALEA